MGRSAVTSFAAKTYELPRGIARRVAFRLRDLIRTNIRQHRAGDGTYYPLTRFPDGAPRRVPFLKIVNDWNVHMTATGYEVKPGLWFWRVHQKGATIRPKKGKWLRIPYQQRLFFAKKVILPPRDPVPGPRRVVQLIRDVIR